MEYASDGKFYSFYANLNFVNRTACKLRAQAADYLVRGTLETPEPVARTSQKRQEHYW